MDGGGSGHMLAQALEQQGRLVTCSGNPVGLGLIFSRQVAICLFVKIKYFLVPVSAVKSLVVCNFWISLSLFTSQMIGGRLTC